MWSMSSVYRITFKIHIKSIEMYFEKKKAISSRAFQVLIRIFPPFSSDIAETSLIPVMKDNIVEA